MKSVNEVKKQVSGLINGIKECNFIPTEDKKDISQNVWEKLIQKYNEGVIVDDASEIKGYVFQVVRNACLAFHRKESKRINVPLQWDVEYQDGIEEKELREEMISTINANLQSISYSIIQKKIIELLLDNKTNEEIRSTLDLTAEQLRRYKHSVVMKLKYDQKKNPKYLIKNIDDSRIKIKCYSFKELSIFFYSKTPRQIKYMMKNNKCDSQGNYIDLQIKRPQIKKKLN